MRLMVLLVVLALGACGGGGSDHEDLGHPDGAVDAPAPDTGAQDGATCADADADGHPAASCGGDDCDDSDPNRYPGNTELCDGIDQDCDPATLGPDHDGDGFVGLTCCNPQPAGGTLCGTDCDDTRATVSPTAVEACNGIDDNCNGVIDEGLVSSMFYPDCDGDGYGDAAATPQTACSAPPPGTLSCATTGAGAAWVMSGTDCDDAQRMVHPGALAPCDCVPGMHAYDADGDGHDTTACGGDDCDDTNPRFFGGALGTCDCASGAPSYGAETCDGRDEDCNGVVDDPAATNAWCASLPGVAASTCTSGACASVTCASGFADCSSAPGCEVDLSDPSAVCGACGRACAWGCGASGHCDDVVALAAGADSTCAIRASGAVLCWGDDTAHQLGGGSVIASRTSPTVPAMGLADAVQVTEGPRYACVREVAGPHTLSCWGAAPGGLGTVAPTPVPTAPAGTPLVDVDDLAAGSSHVCMVMNAASGAPGVSCFGDNTYGQTYPTMRGVPSFSRPLADGQFVPDAVAVSAGANHSCALRSTGEVSCWGDDTFNQIGTTGTPMLGPTPVSGTTDAVQISSRYYHTCALHPAGGVTCWGGNMFGELGNGTGTAVRGPVDVVGVSDAVQVVAANLAGCARRVGGGVACWGNNAEGTLGDGATGGPDGGGSCSFTPVAVSGLSDAIDLAAGDMHACALRATRDVVCWGRNTNGQLGNGSTTTSNVPVTVLPPP